LKHCPSAHVLPLLLMLAGGGRALEGLRVLRKDDGLRTILDFYAMPSSDATGDWLRPMGVDEAGGQAGLARVHRSVLRRLLRCDGRADDTLDIDATPPQRRSQLFPSGSDRNSVMARLPRRCIADGAWHEQKREGVSLDRAAPPAGTGLVRKHAALSLIAVQPYAATLE
jgi:hypothetical protein